MLHSAKIINFAAKNRLYLHKKDTLSKQIFLIAVSKNITHEGIVMEVDGQWVTVRFVQHSACSACHAKALCTGGTSESAERQVVANSYGISYQPGDKVRVIVGGGLAWSAVVIAFLLPLVLALVCLFVTVGTTDNEVLGCLTTFVVLAIYYLGVWLMRHRLERKVEFTLQHLV